MPRFHLVLAAWFTWLLAVQAAAQPPAPAAPEAPPPPVAAPRDPLVEALLETQPTSPPELVRAVDLLVDLKHPDLAREFLNRLLAANLDDEALADLHRRFGTPTFLRMALQEELQPEGRQFAGRVLEAAERQARDAQRLARLIGDLTSPSPETRAIALSELRRAGSDAAVALIEVLADPQREQQHPAVKNALLVLRSASVGPLLATLEAPDAQLKAHAAEVLGRLGAAEAVPHLLAPAVSEQVPPPLRAAAQTALMRIEGQVPERQAAASRLYALARGVFEQAALADPQAPANQAVWRWDPQAGRPVERSYTPTEAALAQAVRLAGDLYALVPDSLAARRLYLAALLESASLAAGIDQPLPEGPSTAREAAAAAGPQALEDLLAHTIASGHLRAATAAAEILGQIGSEALLQPGPRPSVLVEAATHPDRRLRFAAVEAVLKLAPRRPYPGSSDVLDSLAGFAATLPFPRALVADAELSEARRLAGLLSALGYESDIATTAGQFLQMAAAGADYELALVDFHLPPITAVELTQRVRHHPRSAALPLGLIVSPPDQPAAERLARAHPHTSVVLRPAEVAGMQSQVERLLAEAAPRRLALDVRLAQARQALEWLGRLAAEPSSLYDLEHVADEVELALDVPELSPLAAQVMGQLPSPGAQRALVNVASQLTRPLEVRQAAAQAFAQSVERYGILLTSGEILRQYHRYNASETQPVETQQVLSEILDTLESRLPREGS